ncbi:MAG: hypothetical protein QM773_08385 [Hyphomonadaceae bacterium]
MNAMLLGAASLGALITLFTHEPANIDAAKAAADDAEVARLMEATPDEGSMEDVTLVDPKTGETTTVQTLSFKG